MSVQRCLLFTLSLAPLLGCDPPPSTAKADDEEPKTAAVTVWGERFEIFLEHRRIVANEPVSFVTHVTDLKTLEPRRQDPVTFELSREGEPPIRHVEPSPKRAGIYLPELTFPKSGPWSVRLRIPVEGVESLVELPAFQVFASRAEAEKAPDVEAPEGIGFLKEQQWKVLTKAEPATRRRMVGRLKLAGGVAARPGLKALVTPPLAGRLLAPPGKSIPMLGDRIEAGQTLALVQPPFSDVAAKIVEAEADVARTRLAAEQAEQVLARVRKLVEAQAKTERELREAEFASRSAQAAQQAALAIHGAYQKAGAVLVSGHDGGLPALELKAPISGTVIQVGAVVGEHLAPERTLCTILDDSLVLVEARVPEADLFRLGTMIGASYEDPLEKGRFVPILGEGGGRLVLAGGEVDPSTRTLALVYEVKNPAGRLRVGMTLAVEVETSRVESALAIPMSALVDEDARPVAFVQVGGETFQKRALKLGLREGGFVQVLDGIAEGERVVVKEAYTIRLSSVSSVIPEHGHSH